MGFMKYGDTLGLLLVLLLICIDFCVMSMTWSEKKQLREQVREMFLHGYLNYMNKAYPADELMPISCRGRYRGVDTNRGDIDDALGNFSLTLIDSLDTLPILGEFVEFDRAVKLVIDDVTFETDVVVSTFETNIRVLGGLLGGHVMAKLLQKKKLSVEWYQDELLAKALDLGYRLLPAFNTTTGIPFPKINLKHGITGPYARTGHEQETCTACAGSMLLEFAALSRLSGESIFEEKAHKAMEALWRYRNRGSDLMGTVINFHNGDWVRRDSGVGAGIDSYYEYVFKAYILLGDDSYLARFNKHYAAVMKYVSQGPMMLDVHMHKPMTNSRNFMDALLAFWPGLQILKGDIKQAVETHEMLYQVFQRHHFIPEAFTPDFRVHWPQHLLRPEFVESTYLIYRATGDPYYLNIGKMVVENLNKYARVPCGFAALKDVTTKTHEDQMDSFVLAETFKYLYLLFSDDGDLIFNVDDYIFTTEAHFLPLALSIFNSSVQTKVEDLEYNVEDDGEDTLFERSCMNIQHLYKDNKQFMESIREPVQSLQPPDMCQRQASSGSASNRIPRVKAAEFSVNNADHMEHLKKMGIRTITMNDGRVQLVHAFNLAESKEAAEEGAQFMQEMIELSKNTQTESPSEPRIIQFVSAPFIGSTVLQAGPAQFGWDFKQHGGVRGLLVETDPFLACQPLVDDSVSGKIGVTERGGCMFVDKARNLEAAGALGMIVIDNQPGSSVSTSPVFAMSGDGKQDINIPVVFLFNKEGQHLLTAMRLHVDLEVYIGQQIKPLEDVLRENEALERNEYIVDPNVAEGACPAIEVNRYIRLMSMPEGQLPATKSTSSTPSLNSIMSKYVRIIATENQQESKESEEEGYNEVDTKLEINGQTISLNAVLDQVNSAAFMEDSTKAAVSKAVQTAFKNVLSMPGVESDPSTDAVIISNNKIEVRLSVDPERFKLKENGKIEFHFSSDDINEEGDSLSESNGQFSNVNKLIVDELAKLISQTDDNRQFNLDSSASQLNEDVKQPSVLGPAANEIVAQEGNCYDSSSSASVPEVKCSDNTEDVAHQQQQTLSAPDISRNDVNDNDNVVVSNVQSLPANDYSVNQEADTNANALTEN